MCGIAGFLRGPRATIESGALFSSLGHRGPDDYGWLGITKDEVRAGRSVPEESQYDALIVHWRLAIIDLTSAGHQPMSSPDGRFHITFNGEIYNYLELREELTSVGYVFRSGTDTEVLLAAWRCWGREVLPRLIGMFAFAIVDMHTRRIALVRDCFGIKPLYYAFINEGVVFASEPQALLEVPGINRAVNKNSLYNFLKTGRNDFTPESFFEQIKQLAPGHMLETSLDEPQKRSSVSIYYHPTFKQANRLSLADASDRLKSLLTRSVELHYRGDVPIGAALSGGIDSSAIVCLLRQQAPTAPIHTFSYIADEQTLNEFRWASLVAKHVGAIEHPVYLDAQTIERDIDKVVLRQGEPFGTASIVAQYKVFEAAAGCGMKVILDGQGADELFGGYVGYLNLRLRELLRTGQLWAAYQLCANGAAKVGLTTRAWMAMSLRHEAIQSIRSLRWSKGTVDALRKRRSARRPKENINLFDDSASIESPANDVSLRERLVRDTFAEHLPALLRFEDRNSMAHSVESRVPFLTLDIAKFALSLPEHYWIDSQASTKRILRDAMRGIVPDQILDRKDKIGFAAPDDGVVRKCESHVCQTLTSSICRRLPGINLERLGSMVDEARNGQRSYGGELWRLFIACRWIELFGLSI